MNKSQVGLILALAVAVIGAAHYRGRYNEVRSEFVHTAIEQDRAMLELRIEDRRRQAAYSDGALMTGGRFEVGSGVFKAELHVHLPREAKARAEALAFLDECRPLCPLDAGGADISIQSGVVIGDRYVYSWKATR